MIGNWTAVQVTAKGVVQMGMRGTKVMTCAGTTVALLVEVLKLPPLSHIEHACCHRGTVDRYKGTKPCLG